MKEKVLLIIIGVLLLATVGILAIAENEEFNVKDILSSVKIDTEHEQITALKKQLEYQEEVQEKLSEVVNGEYTFFEPYVEVDPYNISPLSAIVIFDTNYESKISVKVEAEGVYSEVEFEFDEYNLKHQIPIYGLYANKENKVILTAVNQTGSVSTNELVITTEDIPEYLNTVSVETTVHNIGAYNKGFTFQYSSGKYGYYTIKSAIDINGEYRYVCTLDLLQSTIYNYNNGNILFAAGQYHEGEVLIGEMNLLGQILNVYSSSYGSHHSMEVLENSNILIAGSKGSTVEDMVYELDISTGEIVKEIDYKEFLQENKEVLKSDNVDDDDWAHINHLEYSQSDNSLISSLRNQSLIVKHSYDDNQIKWMLTPEQDWGEEYEDYLLTPIGTEFDYSYQQHYTTILDDIDNNVNTVDILVFDNGNGRELYTGKDEESYSRVVQYRINEADMTVEQIWEYSGKSEGIWSEIRGSANRYSNGNVLISFNVTEGDVLSKYQRTIEVDSSGNIIWEAVIRNNDEEGYYGDYTVERLSMYGDLANLLDVTKSVNNLSKE